MLTASEIDDADEFQVGVHSTDAVDVAAVLERRPHRSLGQVARPDAAPLVHDTIADLDVPFRSLTGTAFEKIPVHRPLLVTDNRQVHLTLAGGRRKCENRLTIIIDWRRRRLHIRRRKSFRRGRIFFFLYVCHLGCFDRDDLAWSTCLLCFCLRDVLASNVHFRVGIVVGAAPLSQADDFSLDDDGRALLCLPQQQRRGVQRGASCGGFSQLLLRSSRRLLLRWTLRCSAPVLGGGEETVLLSFLFRFCQYCDRTKLL